MTVSPNVMKLNHLDIKRFYSFPHYTNTNSIDSHSLSFEYFAFPNIDSLGKDLTLFGKLEFGGAMKPTDDGIPVLTDRVGALEIHNKILY